MRRLSIPLILFIFRFVVLASAATMTLMIEDTSPSIQYAPSGAWKDASSHDTAGLAYSGNSFHSTTTRGATATISFNGTGIEIFGGRRPDFGTMSLSIDGKVVSTGTSTGPGVETQQKLSSATGLPNGPHTAVVTSTGVGMEVDYVNILTQVGFADSVVTSTVYDDASPEITYAGNWQSVNNPAYTNGTLHYTQAQGAAASLAFTGNALAIYGTVSPDHANIQVSIDGQSTLIDTQSSSLVGLHPQTLLYYASNLDSSQHMLIITNPGQQDGTGPFIDIDSINVFTATGGTAASNDPVPSTISNQASSGLSTNKPGLPTGALVGIIIGVLLIILALVGLVAFLVWRRKRRAQQDDDDPHTPIGAALPLQGPNMRFTPVTPLSAHGPLPPFAKLASRQSAHSIAPSYYGGEDIAPIRSNTPLVPKLGMPKIPARAQQGRDRHAV